MTRSAPALSRDHDPSRPYKPAQGVKLISLCHIKCFSSPSTESEIYYNGHLTRLSVCCCVSRVMCIVLSVVLCVTSNPSPGCSSSWYSSRHYNVRLIRPLHTRTVPAAELDRSHDQVGPCTFPDQDPSRRTNQYQGVKRDFTSLQWPPHTSAPHTHRTRPHVTTMSA